jgi:hypothetical protein
MLTPVTVAVGASAAKAAADAAVAGVALLGNDVAPATGVPVVQLVPVAQLIVPPDDDEDDDDEDDDEDEDDEDEDDDAVVVVPPSEPPPQPCNKNTEAASVVARSDHLLNLLLCVCMPISLR